MKDTAGELGSGEAVRGVPEGVEEQLEQLKVRTQYAIPSMCSLI